MPRNKKTDEVPDVFLVCGWHDCQYRALLSNFLEFRSHVEEHISDILPSYCNRRCTEKVPDDFVCMWAHCGWDTPEDANELIRHLLFHALHTKLKALGTRKQIAQNLSECTLEIQGQNLVPEVQKPFLCEWENCEMEINCPFWFYQHVESHVMAVDKQRNEEDDVGYVACGWEGCKVSVKNHYKLKEHCRTHTQEKVYACSVCGGMFASMSKLIDHLTRQNQSEYQSFQCSHCLKHCGSQRILRDHMRHHVNNIKCKFCDMTCPNPSALKQHIKFRHSDDRPYECDLCEASWKTLSDLRRHRESHNSVLSYKCSVDGCDFSARAVQTLKRHFKVEHQGEELAKYECHICATRYTRGTGLTQHLKTKHKFRWPSGHPRFRYKEYEDGIWRLQTVRFESLQLSQQFINENQSEEQEEVMQEEQSVEEEDPSHDSSTGHIHYQTIDSPAVASISGPMFDSRNQTTHSGDIQEENNSINTRNTSLSGEQMSSDDNVQYLVLPYGQHSVQGRQENPTYFDNESVRKNRTTKRNHPYERPLSPSLDVPQTLLALQEVATRLAANNDLRGTNLSNNQT